MSCSILNEYIEIWKPSPVEPPDFTPLRRKFDRAVEILAPEESEPCDNRAFSINLERWSEEVERKHAEFIAKQNPKIETKILFYDAKLDKYIEIE